MLRGTSYRDTDRRSADSGTRHLSKFHNDDVMKERGFDVSDVISGILQMPTKE